MPCNFTPPRIDFQQTNICQQILDQLASRYGLCLSPFLEAMLNEAEDRGRLFMTVEPNKPFPVTIGTATKPILYNSRTGQLMITLTPSHFIRLARSYGATGIPLAPAGFRVDLVERQVYLVPDGIEFIVHLLKTDEWKTPPEPHRPASRPPRPWTEWAGS